MQRIYTHQHVQIRGLAPERPHMPRTVLNKSLLLHMIPDRSCTMKKLSEGDGVIVGRFPSQGS